MAKLFGPLKLRGSVGGLTFTAGDDGQTYVKEKSSPRACRMRTGEEFAKSRRAAAEFKLATNATRVFRLAMGDLKKGLTDRHMTGRMHAWFAAGVETDKVNEWGSRRVQDSDLSLLEGFEFNRTKELEDVLPLNVANCATPDGRQVRIAIPGFRLRRDKKKVPVAATHFRIVSAFIYADFGNKTYSSVVEAGEMTKIGRKSGGDFEMTHVANPAAGQLCFWLLGIEFYREEGNKLVVVRGGVLRCMKVWGT